MEEPWSLSCVHFRQPERRRERVSHCNPTSTRRRKQNSQSWGPPLGELGDLVKGSDFLERAHRFNPEDPVTTAIAMAGKRDLKSLAHLEFPINAARGVDFWNGLLGLCRNYPPFGRLLIVICELVQELEPRNRFVKLFKAVALGQLREFPRGSVAFEDALTDDPIELLKNGQHAIETVLAAAVKSGRIRDVVEVLIERRGRMLGAQSMKH